jgi:hypothetical protein
MPPFLQGGKYQQQSCKPGSVLPCDSFYHLSVLHIAMQLKRPTHAGIPM